MSLLVFYKGDRTSMVSDLGCIYCLETNDFATGMDSFQVFALQIECIRRKRMNGGSIFSQ